MLSIFEIFNIMQNIFHKGIKVTHHLWKSGVLFLHVVYMKPYRKKADTVVDLLCLVSWFLLEFFYFTRKFHSFKLDFGHSFVYGFFCFVV